MLYGVVRVTFGEPEHAGEDIGGKKEGGYSPVDSPRMGFPFKGRKRYVVKIASLATDVGLLVIQIIPYPQ